MSVLDPAFKQIAMMSTLQEQFNAQNKSFLAITRTLVFFRVEGGVYQEVGVDSYDKEHISQGK